MKKYLLLIVSFIIMIPVIATHQRAAEITFKHISALTYEITIITYTYTPSPADRPTLDIYWGDEGVGEGPTTIYRTQKINLPDNISKNVYEGSRHTYPGPSSYIIAFEDPNRNFGVVNIPNSVNVPMFVETMLVINSFLGVNNSPVLLNPPVDLGCVEKPYVHNPGAYDIDGDSQMCTRCSWCIVG